MDVYVFLLHNYESWGTQIPVNRRERMWLNIHLQWENAVCAFRRCKQLSYAAVSTDFYFIET